MTNNLEISIIFKRKLIFEELRNLLVDVGIKNVKHKTLNDMKKLRDSENFFIIELDSKNTIEEVIKFKNHCIENPDIICLSEKKLNSINELKDLRIIKQPFLFFELLELINKIKDRKVLHKNFVFGDFIYVPQQAKFINNANKVDIKLTDLENKLVLFILKNKNGVSKKSILQNVWEHKTELNTHTLESLIYRLRRKIENDPNNPKILTQIEKKYFLKTENIS